MWRERLMRLLLVGLGALLALGLVRWYVGQQPKQASSAGLSNLGVKEKLAALGENILGATVKVLPGAPSLNEQVNQTDEVNQKNQESEPIKQPVENIQNQTQALIESIKKLPEDQIEAIKRQIYKELCEELIEE